MSAKPRIAVLGGGAWGTALALTMLRGGNDAVLWARDATIVETINAAHRNPRYLPDVDLDERLVATTDLDIAVRDARCVLAVVPAQAMRSLLELLSAPLAAGVPLVLCAKGIERGTGKLLSGIVSEMLPETPIAALSGPSFAADVARGLPTAVTVAADNEAAAVALAALLSAPNFRCYSTGDLIGVEIGGALKNVLAIAAGAVSGARLGASAQAAIVTRGFVELRRIGVAFGGEPETLMGLSGLGDLMLTCGSPQSRNFSFGVALGRGESLDNLPLAEGAATAGVAAEIARARGIEAPIIEAVDRILSRELTIADAISTLMSRPLKSESA